MRLFEKGLRISGLCNARSSPVSEPTTCWRASERLAAIRARLAQATPGPWESKPVHNKKAQVLHGGVTHKKNMSREDADLIAHAPTDIAWLCDTLEAALEVVEAAKEVRAWVKIDAAGEVTITTQAFMEAACQEFDQALTPFLQHTDG